MKKLLLAATALAGIASSALAADLPARGPAVAPAPVAVPIFTWTGFYAGLHAGAAWQDRDNCPQLATYSGGVATAVTAFAPNCDNGRRTNFIGGVQIGYNWQINNFVVGAEGDISWLGNHGRDSNSFTIVDAPIVVQPQQGNGGGGGGGNPNLLVAPSPGTNGTVTNVTNVYSWSGRNQTDMIGTVRLRAGVAFNRALLYVTGGIAFRNGGDNDGVITQTTYTNVTTVPPNPNNNALVTSNTTTTTTTYTRTNNNDDNVGWALGGGVEFALAPNVSTKLEYLHVHFDGGNNGLYLPATPNGSAFIGGRNDNKIDMVRLGVNWRF
jgi:outer membrane immunogenic protein